MKKALVALLLLAVAGGLFAQQLSFSGLVNAGFGWAKYDDQDDNAWGLIGRDQGSNGYRAQINGNVTNDDKNAGLSFRFRVANANVRTQTEFRWAYGWISGLDGMVKVLGGYIQGSDFDALDTQGGQPGGFYDNAGLIVYVSPIDMFKFGVGVASNGQSFSANKNVDNVEGWLGFGVSMPDLFDLNAQLKSKRDDANAMFSVSVGVLPDIGIKATAAFLDLTNFSDSGIMTFYEEVNLNIIENLGLNVALSQSMNNAENTDMAFRGWVWLTYAMGNIVPRFDVNYIMGAKMYTNFGLNPIDTYQAQDFAWAGDCYDGDYSYLTVSPSVKLRVASNKFVELGYMFAMDMSQNDKVAVGGKNGGVNHAAFVDLRVSF